MATLNELSYNVLNIARGGLSSDDDRLNIRQIKFWIGYYRAYAIKESLKKGTGVDSQLVQDLGVLTLESVDKADHPKVLWGCEVKRVRVPKLVDLPNDSGLVFIGLVDKQTPIILSPPNVVHFKAHQRFTGNMRRAYLIGGYLYVTDPFNEDICYVNVRGIFDNPSDAGYQGADGDYTCIDDDDEYPMPESYVPLIVNYIMQKELNMTIKTTNDENNDSRESNTQINDQKEIK